METSQEFTDIKINHDEPAQSDNAVAQAEKVFGTSAHNRAGEFWTAIWAWSHDKQKYHSLELYNYAKTLSSDPDDLFLLGVIAATVVHKTALPENAEPVQLPGTQGNA